MNNNHNHKTKTQQAETNNAIKKRTKDLVKDIREQKVAWLAAYTRKIRLTTQTPSITTSAQGEQRQTTKANRFIKCRLHSEAFHRRRNKNRLRLFVFCLFVCLVMIDCWLFLGQKQNQTSILNFGTAMVSYGRSRISLYKTFMILSPPVQSSL